MAFTCADLQELADLVASAWRTGADRDWSARAGTLDWSCAATADHAVDTVFAPAMFLASRKLDAYPSYAVATPGPNADPLLLVEALETAVRVLVGVVTAAPPGVRAIIWQRPKAQARGPSDFPPRAGLELILHAHDVCTGLGIPFRPPGPLCDRLREHTRTWPHWHSAGWVSLAMVGEAWPDLLRSSGRAAIA
jgi:hypothetical protein